MEDISSVILPNGDQYNLKDYRYDSLIALLQQVLNDIYLNDGNGNFLVDENDGMLKYVRTVEYETE